MAYFLHYSKCYNIAIEEHYGAEKENHTEFGGTYCARKGIPLRFMPSFPYALQGSVNESRQRESIHHWKTQSRMTPAAKIDLTPENNLLLTPEEFGRRGQFYFGLSAFEGFEFTDAFTG